MPGLSYFVHHFEGVHGIKVYFYSENITTEVWFTFLQLQTSFISICLHHDIYNTADNQSKYVKINPK